jgi:hypothetical protein
MRDKSYASEAANARIFGATRLHCDDYKDDLYDEEAYYETGGGLTERAMGRGHVTESQSELFNKRLRGGQHDERIRFRVED